MKINSRYKDLSRPVFGRILHKEPLQKFRNFVDRNRNGGYDDTPRNYLAENKQRMDAILHQQQFQHQKQNPRRRVLQFRFSGNSNVANSNVLTPQRGSFQRLKELIWTERARELAQQRKAEEMAARAAVLKEITNGQR